MKKPPTEFVIAVVDDDDALRTAIASLLLSDGFLVERFGSAEDFLQSPWRTAAQGLILDMRLPGLSGIQLLQLLTTGGSSIQAICVTGQSDDDGRIRESALRAGARYLFYKPFDSDELLKAVRSICGGGSALP